MAIAILQPSRYHLWITIEKQESIRRDVSEHFNWNRCCFSRRRSKTKMAIKDYCSCFVPVLGKGTDQQFLIALKLADALVVRGRLRPLFPNEITRGENNRG
jgi:hypothetical protein